jgi:hypothetical protein
MAKFVDIPLDTGNANDAITQLNAGATEESTSPRQTQTNRETRTAAEPVTDPRFSGKSTEEIYSMYKNLESHAGRLASQLGESRNALNSIILGKRDNDLRQNGGARDPVKIQPTDLLSNPTEALERYMSSRENPEVQTLKERLAQLESQLTQTSFTTRHPDAEQETADPEFARCVQQSPLRSRLANQAANNDFRAADDLLTEWRLAKSQGNTVSSVRTRAQDLAKNISLESNNVGSESGQGKANTGSTRTFKRTDLIALRQNNPDLYESKKYQDQIVAAYREGRVVD